MASHHLLRRSRAAHFGMFRALGHNVATFLGIRGLFAPPKRFFAQSHGLSRQFKLRLMYCIMLKGLRGMVGCLVCEGDGRHPEGSTADSPLPMICGNSRRDIHARSDLATARTPPGVFQS